MARTRRDDTDDVTRIGANKFYTIQKSKYQAERFLRETRFFFLSLGELFKTCLLTLGSPLWYK
jgi:hypothetical protein